MEHPQGYAVPTAEALRERWRATSLDSVWLRPGDWYHPAVDALTEAVVERSDGSPAAERLGAARAEAGISIGETIDDVSCLYAVTGTGTAPHRVVRALSTGWVTGYEAQPVQVAVDDPATGLATVPYLVQRLRETYGAAVRTGTEPSRTHCLVVVDVAVAALSGYQSFTRSAAMGRALIDTFGEGFPMAHLGNGTFVALCERTPELDGVRGELRHRVERTALLLGVTAVLRRPPRVWVEPLPPTHDAARALLRVLQR